MRRNPQDIKKAAEMEKLSALIIMFLVAAMVFLLFMLMSAGKALADPWGRGMGPKLGQRPYVNNDLTHDHSAKKESAHVLKDVFS